MTSSQNTFILQNVHVFDGNQFGDLQQISVENGVITNITSNNDQSSAQTSEVIDGKQGYVLPGLMDSHVHIFESSNLEELTEYGVTSGLVMACWPQNLLQEFRDYAETNHLTNCLYSSLPAMGVVTVHGIMMHPDIKDMIKMPAQAPKWVQTRVDDPENSDFIKIICESGGPNEQLVRTIVTEARKKGIRCAAHAADGDATCTALRGGVEVLTHLPKDVCIDNECTDIIKKNKVLSIPTLIMLAGTCSMGASKKSGDGGNNYQNVVDSFQAVLKLGTPIHVGTDSNASNKPSDTSDVLSKMQEKIAVHYGDSIHEEFCRMSAAGMDKLQILRAATIEPAKYWGLNDRGEIKPQKRADLLLLEKDPLADISNTQTIQRVFVQGYQYGGDSYASPYKDGVKHRVSDFQ